MNNTTWVMSDDDAHKILLFYIERCSATVSDCIRTDAFLRGSEPPEPSQNRRLCFIDLKAHGLEVLRAPNPILDSLLIFLTGSSATAS